MDEPNSLKYSKPGPTPGGYRYANFSDYFKGPFSLPTELGIKIADYNRAAIKKRGEQLLENTRGLPRPFSTADYGNRVKHTRFRDGPNGFDSEMNIDSQGPFFYRVIEGENEREQMLKRRS